jgi:hypothetical protein
MEYISSFRERVHNADGSGEYTSKNKKNIFDMNAVSRSFSEGDKILVLLLIQGAALQARLSGPYVIDRQLSETNYVVWTPDRQRKTSVCHVNMLKLYVNRGEDVESKCSVITPVASIMVASDSDIDADGLNLQSTLVLAGRLNNSKILENLNSQLVHLSDPQQTEIVKLINFFMGWFSEVPSCT